MACEPGTTTLHLKPTLENQIQQSTEKSILESNASIVKINDFITKKLIIIVLDCANFDIKTELDEFEKDLSFLKFIQSDDVFNVENFLNVFFFYIILFLFFKIYSESSNLSSIFTRKIS